MLAPKTEVIVIRDGDELSRHIFEPGEYEIGRAQGCAIMVPEGQLSRRHARLTLNFDHALIEDLGSINGTFVADRPVTSPTRLWPNQKIRLGPAITLTLRRLKGETTTDVSLAPAQAAVKRILPEEILREKRYDIGGVFAQGGMGAILKAREAATNRTVAMKVMLDQASPEDVTRFIAEAKITGQLEHPNIVPVHELGIDENEQVYYTMKLVRGVTLKKILELIAAGTSETIKKYPLANLLTVFQKVGDAIAFAHSKNVIHRDLKPENIMIGDFGEVLVMDWGLAKVLGAAPTTPAPANNPMRSMIRTAPAGGFAGSSTMAGAILGTPQYMAPEQATGDVEALDARSDVYTLGAILYEILTLRAPIPRAPVDAMLEQVRSGRITPAPKAYDPPKRGRRSHLPGRRVPEALAAVTTKAMALRPENRYASVGELQQEIEAFQNGFATHAEHASRGRLFLLFVRRNKMAVAAALLVFVLLHVFLASVVLSQRRLQATFARLRGTAPIFQSRALALIAASPGRPEALDEALASINEAIEIAPEDSGYRAVKGRILETELRLSEAHSAFAEAVKRDPGNSLARENLEVCEAMRPEEIGPGEFTSSGLGMLLSTMQREGRLAESLVLLGRSKNSARVRETWGAVLAKAGIARKPDVLPDGMLQLSLGNIPLDNLNAVRGLPLAELSFDHDNVSDLSPLAGMQLRKLSFSSNAVSDLSPLSGMPLKELSFYLTRVVDLSPLAGIPIESLTLSPTVQEFGDLHGLPLRSLDLGHNGRLADLKFLMGLKLTKLDISAATASDLGPLKGMPLASLSAENCPNLRDLSPLEAMPLTTLSLNNCRHAADLAPLHAVPLESITLLNTLVDDVRPLAGTPVRHLDLSGTPFVAVAQLTGLKKLEELILNQTFVTDLSPLGQTGVKVLALGQCPNLKSADSLAGLQKLVCLQLPVQIHDLSRLRGLPSLQWIGYTGPPLPKEAATRGQELKDFWKMNEAEEKARAADPEHRLLPAKFPFMEKRFPGAKELHGHWYCTYQGSVSWTGANELAHAMGGHLAVVHGADEDAFIRKTFAVGISGLAYWIGAHAEPSGGGWRWINGEKWGFTRWGIHSSSQNEPSSARAASNPPKNCVGYTSGGDMTNFPAWADFPDMASVGSGFIVEWDNNAPQRPLPKPATPAPPAKIENSSPEKPTAEPKPPTAEEKQAEAEMEASDTKALAEAKAATDALTAELKLKEAIAALKKVEMITDKGKSDKEALLKKLDWLDGFKAMLMQDIGTTGYPGGLARKTGLAIAGRVTDADDTNLILKVQSSTLQVPWVEASFESLYNMALSFLRADLPPDRLADRMWCLGVYCDFAGKPKLAAALFTEAIKKKPAYEPEWKLFPQASRPK